MEKQLVRFDWAMKKLLRHKANFDILEGFLSELLKIDIRIESILESEANQEDEYDKYNRVDILVKSPENELMLIEVQQDSENDYFHRMLYGVSKLVTEYIQIGEPYGTIKKVFSINIVYFGLGQGKDYVYEYRGEFYGLHDQDILMPTLSQQRNYKVQKVSDIFPKYYILRINNFNKVAENTLDEWIYFLKNSEVKDSFRAKGLDKAREKLRYEKLSDEDKKRYQRSIENKRIEMAVRETAIIEAETKGLEKGLVKGLQKGLEEGLQKGLEEGLQKGLEEGLQKGLEKGLEEGLEKGLEKGHWESKKEVAKKMILAGSPDDFIAQITGLSSEMLEALRKEI